MCFLCLGYRANICLPQVCGVFCCCFCLFVLGFLVFSFFSFWEGVGSRKVLEHLVFQDIIIEAVFLCD